MRTSMESCALNGTLRIREIMRESDRQHSLTEPFFDMLNMRVNSKRGGGTQ